MNNTQQHENTSPVSVADLKLVLLQPHARLDDRSVQIVVQHAGGMGGTPSVSVGQVSLGFDWDSRKLLLFPTVPLTSLTPEQVNAIEKSVQEGQSWHAMGQYDKYRAQITTLKNNNAKLSEAIKTILVAENLTADQRTALQSALAE